MTSTGDTAQSQGRRYRLIHSHHSVGSFSEFSAASDEEAIEHARRGLYGARIVSLVEIEHWASGDVTRTILVPE